MNPVDLLPELILSAPANLRDLGGIVTRDGVVRDGFAIRADDLSIADPDSARKLADGGLTTLIDLRSPAEVRLTGRGPLADLPVTYHHVPFIASVAETTRTAVNTRDLLDQSTFADMYIRMFETAAPHIVTALSIIAHSPGAVAFHCAAGQDRTGVLAASLLLALGADDDAIVADYIATGANTDGIAARTHQVVGPLLETLGVELDEGARAALRNGFSPEPMRGLLGYLTATYGGRLEPLRRAGLGDGLVERLRERAIAP
ncbi:tyrosine-protein phosphatase [Rhodococcus triatomae]|uniref:Tyrosine phosphatase family protein n=1 Tax=Rhodococcus triatomae TaxID=300028 RepID=A0A1G8CQE4_9NOCA|nr:tyrosine-protein phosphatase [Rhodococcus triatomae]QNG18607.1 tyrosine-protein phosphatase [Rhodococcus triatomae]QNG21724.1 tyrosine-protein phosphatase [Rhodococcus triatomae]SDH47110.1 Tyrosine phosphatase family protein [Rhodococcus triatomae]